MLNFFQTIIEYIQIIWEFFLNIINSLLTLFTTLLMAATVPVSVAGLMWPPIGTCVLAITGFSIVKMIVGRSNV